MLMAMKTTTLSLEDDLVQAVERKARQTGQTPDQVVNRALREALLERKTWEAPEFRWVVVKGESPPDIDISDRNALFERMEDRS
jgi:hypothetical protein